MVVVVVVVLGSSVDARLAEVGSVETSVGLVEPSVGLVGSSVSLVETEVGFGLVGSSVGLVGTFVCVVSGIGWSVGLSVGHGEAWFGTFSSRVLKVSTDFISD